MSQCLDFSNPGNLDPFIAAAGSFIFMRAYITRLPLPWPFMLYERWTGQQIHSRVLASLQGYW